MVTNWIPDLASRQGPLYVRIADCAEADIKTGKLPAEAKLPPQRDLAYDLGVTIGTITRAYALLRERGLVSGEVGRGSGASVMGHPFEALAWLANARSMRDEGLRRGEFVFLGSLVETKWLDAGDTVTIGIERLGEVALSVSE